MIYLDNAATKPLYPDVKKLIIDNLDEFGNASSLYDIGYNAYKKLEESREIIASLINAEPNEIYFTSGGSEADSQAIKTVLNNKNKGAHVITSSFEHPAVLNAINQCVNEDGNDINVRYVNPNISGLVDLNSIDSVMRGLHNKKLISIMYVNNEIGTIQPIKSITKLAHQYGAFMHTDAVQAVGTIPIDVKELGVDMLSASGHKFGAPKGIGFLYCKNGIQPYKLVCGGLQENGYRAGTQNVLGAMAMAKALEISCKYIDAYDGSGYVKHLRNMILDDIFNISGFRINGDPCGKVSGIINVSFEGVSGEEIQTLMNERGFAISTGSACHSGQAMISETLKAIQVPDEFVNGTIRISLGCLNTVEEVRKFTKNLKEVIEILRKY